MCSIAGSYSEEAVDLMLDLQQHRAPDDSGTEYIEQAEFTFGMGRLSIIDLVSDNLCPHVSDGYVLSYNGEVYNYLELKVQLQNLGHKFETTSDTEVVLAAYKQWGFDCFNKFNGMFAIAIYDPKSHSIVLARDIAGQKPLFYRTDEFAFASEAKALKNDNSQYTKDVFFDVFQHIYEGTLWSNIRQVKPAHYLEYDIGTKKTRSVRYWKFEPRYIDLKTVYDELEYLIGDAVNLVQRSDVPYALYYSGGVDSTIISKVGYFKNKITFTDISEEQFYEDINEVVEHLDFPVGSFSSVALYQLAKRAQEEGFKVIISGEGADEIFGGYIRYVPIAQFSSMYDRYPSYAELFNKTHKPSYVKITKRTEGTDNFLSRHMEPFFKEHDPVTAMQLFDFTYILPSLLQMGDRMASAFGIENRCPFLDKRLIEFGLSLPANMKIDNMDTKVTLRTFLDDLGGRDINDEKVGLIVPYNKWKGIKGYSRSAYFAEILDIWKKQNSVQ